MRERRGGHNRKINSAQRYELLREYFVNGRRSAETMAASLGLKGTYAATLASQLGYRPVFKPIPTQHKWGNP